MATSNDKFRGWVAHNKDSINGQMKWEEYEPRTWTENDVDIKIEACGMCGSDTHTLRSGWRQADYPIVVGHEIVGRAVRVGRKAEGGIKVGDRVGVGAQCSSCLRPDCEECSEGQEQHCRTKGQNVQTYDARFPNGDKAYGGYALYARMPSHFVIKIPDAIPAADAAPMMCGGVTSYTPLVENGAAGKRVGVVGIGGLGHFALLFAKALGAKEITAISRTSSKKDDALKMGASRFIATDEEDKWQRKYARTLDLIICTVSSHNMPLSGYLSLLRTRGQFIQIGAPEDKIPAFNMFEIITKKAKIGGSAIGSPQQIRDMLQLVVDKGIKPWINARPMEEANQAVIDLDANKARYRYVLVNKTTDEKL